MQTAYVGSFVMILILHDRAQALLVFRYSYFSLLILVAEQHAIFNERSTSCQETHYRRTHRDNAVRIICAPNVNFCRQKTSKLRYCNVILQVGTCQARPSAWKIKSAPLFMAMPFWICYHYTGTDQRRRWVSPMKFLADAHQSILWIFWKVGGGWTPM